MGPTPDEVIKAIDALADLELIKSIREIVLQKIEESEKGN